MTYYLYDAEKLGTDARLGGFKGKNAEDYDGYVGAIDTMNKRAIVIAHAIHMCLALGIASAYVKNMCKDRHSGTVYENQSWYVFAENGHWYYKQSKNTKAKHLVPMEV